MAEHDRAGERLHRRFEDVLGEPEATMLIDRLVTREDIQGIVRTGVEVLRREVETVEERLNGTVERVARQNLVTLLTVMGVFNGIVFAALRFS